MYETVLKHIAYNYDIPNDIIQLIYNELNKKHQCAIIIQDEIKRLIAEKTRRLWGIKYFMIEPIYDEPHYFIYKSFAGQIIQRRETYCNSDFIYRNDFNEIKNLYKLMNEYQRIILQKGFNINGFFKNYKK